eukprot:3202884-Alexandrium_andersonii.AAC.1
MPGSSGKNEDRSESRTGNKKTSDNDGAGPSNLGTETAGASSKAGQANTGNRNTVLKRKFETLSRGPSRPIDLD